MCGIAGIYNIREPFDISMDTLKSMTNALNHRGPDDCGIYLDDWVGLGHTRLSVIDLSSGVQPIHNMDKTKWIVYNGEVYNYQELHSDLRKLGHKFYTTTDSEVVLHMFEEKGINCLKELNGQFAFAIWDNKKKELFLARDRVGIRPLHFSIIKDRLLFASEIKSLFMNKNTKREIDPIAFDQVFTFWSTLADRTPFKNIKELLPAHYMIVSNGKVTIKKYWDVPFYPEIECTKKSLHENIDELRSLLIDAIKIRLRADVQVGTYLSGGLDSSAISAMVAKNLNRQISTFGIRFEENDFDEGNYQKLVASSLNTKHHEIMASNEKIGQFFPDVIRHCEKPLLRTAPVPLFLLSQKVREKQLKVVLTGEGADEVFGGYNIFRETKIRNFWAKQPDSKKRAALLGRLYPYIFNNSRQKALLQSFFSKGLDDVENPLYSHLIRWNNTAKLKKFFSDEIKSAIGEYDCYENLKQNLPSDFRSWSSLSKAQYLETTIFLSHYLLSSQGDRVAMAHSVEIRLPFLDPRILDFMGKIPSHWKIRGLNEKYILKKCFQNNLPKQIVNRPKHPYRAPIKQSLLHQKHSHFVKEAVSESSLKKSGLFDHKKVNKFINKLESVQTPSEIDSMGLVGILSSQLLYQQFIENLPAIDNSNSKEWFIVDRRSETLENRN